MNFTSSLRDSSDQIIIYDDKLDRNSNKEFSIYHSNDSTPQEEVSLPIIENYGLTYGSVRQDLSLKKWTQDLFFQPQHVNNFLYTVGFCIALIGAPAILITTVSHG